jgi:hypothetical protein
MVAARRANRSAVSAARRRSACGPSWRASIIADPRQATHTLYGIVRTIYIIVATVKREGMRSQQT